MPFAITTHSGNGAQLTFAIGFTYLRREYVHVFVGGVEKARPADWNFDGGGTNVVFVVAPPSGTNNVVIERQTPFAVRLIDFEDGSGFTEVNLDESAQQLLDVLQEQQDEVDTVLHQTGGHWDAENLRLRNLATPVEAADAVTKAYADTIIGTAAGSAAAAAASATAAAGSATAAAGSETAAASSASAAASSAAQAALVRRNRLDGLRLERTSATNIRIYPGSCSVWQGSNKSAAAADLAATFDKTLTEDVGTTGWEAGTGNDGVPNGLLANNTGYHVFLLRKSSDGTVDFGFDTSVTAANLLAAIAGSPGNSGFDQYRRLGWIRNGTANIAGFTQDGDEFLLDTTQPIVSNNPGTSGVLKALGPGAGANFIPIDIKVRAIFDLELDNNAGGDNVNCLVTSPDQSDDAASATRRSLSVGPGTDATEAFGRFEVRTNTAAQIRFRVDLSNANVNVDLLVHGWIDKRGKDSD